MPNKKTLLRAFLLGALLAIVMTGIFYQQNNERRTENLNGQTLLREWEEIMDSSQTGNLTRDESIQRADKFINCSQQRRISWHHVSTGTLQVPISPCGCPVSAFHSFCEKLT